ncbi:hypothetical protein AB0454_41400 [Streptomyces sp. NPDC093509]|uniref:hypothetical protein n=1 Tax=Streptomyces sp. NPDC093509 TaxID=3154982 RepID=UPI00345019A6
MLHREEPTEPVAELVLTLAEVFYAPHVVSADQDGGSLHITCGLQAHTATD